MKGRRDAVAAVVAGLLFLAIGCGGTEPSTGTSPRPGVTGTSYLVTVSRQAGGTVTSADGRIVCGTAPTAASCGPVSYGWTEAAVLTATPDAGFMFGTWAGDCTGRTKTDAGYVCILDTIRYGADKYVVAVFDTEGRAQHTNFDPSVLADAADPESATLHGSEFLASVAGKPDTFDCAYCHGSTYAGLGIAPSCNACHERAGYPGWQTSCQFCHASPPPDPHPASAIVATPGPPALPGCASCHADTVDAEGNIIPGGTHMNGQLDGGGHEDGYAAPVVHGRDFFATAAVTPTNRCQKCHGAEYASPIVGPAVEGEPFRSCNSCHTLAGWEGGAVAGTGWQTNCSFCHGERSSATQAAPYDVNLFPTRSAPPQAISERLGDAATYDPLDPIDVTSRNGGHARHLETTYTASLWCGSCHEVPTDLTHISGANERAAMLPHLGYDLDGALGRSLTCATVCHGASPSPAWTSTGMQCDGCHAVPPTTSAHVGLDGTDLGGECSGCHANTITTGGAINLAAGGHINGTVDAPLPHDTVDGTPYRMVSVHGARYLDELAGLYDPQMGKACNACHTSHRNCDACHASTTNPAPAISWKDSAGNPTWQGNCTFCHGTRTAAYDASQLPNASPGVPSFVAPLGETVRMRLAASTTVTPADEYRLGKHREHLLQEDPEFPAIACATCHAVPASPDHVSSVGPSYRATMTFDASKAFPALSSEELGLLPSPLATYVPYFTTASGTMYQCNTYCHGSNPADGTRLWPGVTIVPDDAVWTNQYPTLSCSSCHGQPPNTGKVVAWTDFLGRPVTGTAHVRHQSHGCGECHPSATHSTHVNGRKDVTNGWNPATKSCSNVNCHNAPASEYSWY